MRNTCAIIIVLLVISCGYKSELENSTLANIDESMKLGAYIDPWSNTSLSVNADLIINNPLNLKKDEILSIENISLKIPGRLISKSILSDDKDYIKEELVFEKTKVVMVTQKTNSKIHLSELETTDPRLIVGSIIKVSDSIDLVIRKLGYTKNTNEDSGNLVIESPAGFVGANLFFENKKIVKIAISWYMD